MYQPKDFEDKNKPDHVCFLKKSFLWVQYARHWYKIFDSFVLSISFKRSKFDH